MAEERDQVQQQTAEMPPVSFLGHVNELVFTAQAYLGGMQHPETKEPVVELGLARRIIDTLEMLQEKTKGNLNAPEGNYLENMLYDLRMQYVRILNNPPQPPPAEQPEPPAEEESVDTETSAEVTDLDEGSDRQAESEQ